VPDSTSMRRAASAALVALALVALTACGSAKATPGVANENFTPTVELDVGSGALHVTKPGDTSGADVGSVMSGSVLLVKNVDSQNRRVTGTVKEAPIFDTGILHPNDTTTVVLDTSGQVTIAETGTGAKTTLTVKPKPTAKG
jgi:hypothetical protein